MDPHKLAQSWDDITPKLFGYLVNILRDKTLAEDILQSTWMKALDALPRYRNKGKLSAWLFAIARNECKQHWRKINREVPLPARPDDSGRSGGDPDIPDDSSLRLHDAILIDQILVKLSEDDRELLRLRYIADLSTRNISKVLNINPIAVRVRLYRALKRAHYYAQYS